MSATETRENGMCETSTSWMAKADAEIAAVRARTAAHNLFRGNWDSEGTVSAHLPTEIAEKLLAARGWQRNDLAWFSPDGILYWDTGEALQIALASEVL